MSFEGAGGMGRLISEFLKAFWASGLGLRFFLLKYNLLFFGQRGVG